MLCTQIVAGQTAESADYTQMGLDLNSLCGFVQDFDT